MISGVDLKMKLESVDICPHPIGLVVTRIRAGQQLRPAGQIVGLAMPVEQCFRRIEAFKQAGRLLPSRSNRPEPSRSP